MSAHSNYNKIPFIELLGNVTNGWENIVDTLKLDKNKVEKRYKKKINESD